MRARIESLTPSTDGTIEVVVSFTLGSAETSYTFTAGNTESVRDEILAKVSEEASVFKAQMLYAQAEAQKPQLPDDVVPLIGYEIDV